ncbi:signal transduction histidine kinase/ligand-binding sensor domain-containing protein [Granulicella aggregans]|uniref:Signal transduction histidine kinase/ligand-binding sensor domain-containing protein n=1 Tax=Granulicella aggregans TaxID=474949 RepID=A0A7W7ZI40_9BACT|nr:sensor histidine kinase [Granulicella aggregans]MBB5059651.1 signal transduction histidine kinase/ligand-binding sensor domain-containing protein [Granulicella aggregans]
MSRFGAALAAALTLFAIVQPASSGAELRDLRHKVLTTWTTEQGLPQDFVTAIAQTPDGFLWVGTNGGLARFDGLKFRTFLQAPAALRHRITNLGVDARGTLWIGTSTGLFKYESHTFSAVPLEKKASAIEQILCRSDEPFAWVRTKSELYRAGVTGDEFVKVPVLLEKVRSFTVDDKEEQWLADGEAVTQVREGRVVQVYPMPGVNLVYFGPDKRLYAADGHHLFVYANGGFRKTEKEGPEELVTVMVDRSGAIWMASGGLEGISRFAAGKLEILGARDGLASNDAREIFEDKSGDIWVGTISGLQQLHDGTFVSYTERDGLPSGHVQYDAIFEDNAKAIWVGTLESGVAQLTGDRWQSYGIAQGVRRGQVRGLAEDGAHPVIAISDYGLYWYRSGRYRKIGGVPEGYISSPITTADGSLWFSVLRKGVYRLREGVLTSFGAAQGLGDTQVWALAEDGRGALWAGASNGAYRWDGNRWKQEYVTASAVDGIAFSHDGGIYLGTSNGLVYHNDAKSWVLTQEDGLPGDAVFSLVEDARGDLWLATARGVCRISRAQVDAMLAGTKQVAPEVFTEADGLRSRATLPLGQVTSLRAKDGRLWFATAAGPAVAEPGTTVSELPRAMLDDVAVDEEHFGAGPLVVKPGRHRLTFSFTAPVFVAPEQVHFRYRLLGWESDWVNGGDVREASYVGIPPGQYHFEVQALSRDGQAGPVTYTVGVRLQPFFWQTRWFVLLMIALLVAVVIEVTRRRTLRRAESLNLRFQERSAERERLASHIHDTFIQDLTGTALQLELLGLQLEEDPDVARRSLSHLAARMREMIGRSRDIVSNLHSMAGTQYSLLELLSHVETEFRLGESPAFVLQSKEEPRELHPFLRDEVYSICREAVANAFRHAGASVIEVKIVYQANKLLVQIQDDGVGMSDEMRVKGRPGHFGLPGMQAHAQRIDAVLAVESKVGVGTKITLETALRPLEARWWSLPWRRNSQRERSFDQHTQ